MALGLRAPPEPPVDAAALRVELEALAREPGDPSARRAEVVRRLKAALADGRAAVRARLDTGASGIETAGALAQLTDTLVVALHAFALAYVSPRPEALAPALSVVGVGGYGRGVMAPYSDIDLLFLRGPKAEAGVEAVIEVMLYTLWDLGFKVGHASRTVDECLKFAREDFTIRTALLEARWVAGDPALAETLKRRFRKEVAEGTGADFVAAKLAERDARHAKAGASRYMVEPNIKEGKGGLRDLNTLFWIAQYLHPLQEPSQLVRLKEFTRREVKAFVRAFDFLWATRCYLHFITGRPEERLGFELQPEIARWMGYGDRDETASAERFMRRYFLIAREVGALTRIFCAKLEAEHAKQPQGLARLLPRRGPRRRDLGDGFLQEGGRLTLAGRDVFVDDPVRLIRIFRLADAENLDLHPDAFSAVNRSLNLIGAKLRRDPAAARAFLDILVYGQETFRTLSLMNEAGVLARYVPEFGRIVGQMQFNMYHAFTTDEHTLRAVGAVADMARGLLAHDHPLAVSIFPLVHDREALFLAMLLHDTGKGGAPGGQALAGARSARIACERMGLAPERVDAVAWLVQHHLLMSETAQKRDLGDPRTISAFARTVREPERLRALTVITGADIRAVGPGVWNAWKGQLLRQLFTATESVFRGGRASDIGFDTVDDVQHSLAVAARQRLVAALPQQAAAQAWADGMEDAYFVTFSTKAQAGHFALAARAAAEGASASTRLMADWNAVEIAVAARDRRGLFAELAGAMAANGANIVGARVYTSASGGALDVFNVQDRSGAPYGEADPRALDRLVTALEAAGRGEAPDATPRPDPPLGRAAAFDVAARVTVDNEASDLATVVEVSGRDRPGLLQAVAHTLAAAGLSVQSAHIESFGERAVDAFYVVDSDGLKLADPQALGTLKRELNAVLLELEPEVERARARVAERAEPIAMAR